VRSAALPAVRQDPLEHTVHTGAPAALKVPTGHVVPAAASTPLGTVCDALTV